MSRPAEQPSLVPVSESTPQPLTSVTPKPARDARYDWAAERTLLSWVRTGLAMMGFGFVVARFGTFVRALGLTAPGSVPGEEHSSASILAGVLMVACGMAANLMAVQRFLRNHRALTRGEPVDPSPAGPVALAILAALIGASLSFLLGVTLLR